MTYKPDPFWDGPPDPPSICQLCGKPNDDPYTYNHRECEQREAMEADLAH